MLTEYGDEPSFDVRKLAFPVTLHVNPLNRPTLAESILRVYRDVVLSLTGYNTRLAAYAAVYIYNHSPFVRYALFNH
jgi:hypothetical protein